MWMTGLAEILVTVMLAWLIGSTLGGAGFWLALAWRSRAPRHPH
jgi:hypothetical protein